MYSTKMPIEPAHMHAIALFAGLDKANIDAIARGGWALTLDRATRVLSRGEQLDGLYAVFEGQLKLYMLSCSGDERVLRVLRPGDSFGEAIMFNAVPSPVFVESLSSVRLGYFPAQVVKDALAADPDFTAAMLRGMGAMMRELIQDLDACCLQNARQRTVNYLLREFDAAPPPHAEIVLPAPKAVIASTLNIAAETFSRELHHLQHRGLIQINRRTLYLRDRTGLIDALADGSATRASALADDAR